MTSTPLQPAPASIIDSSLITCDPDFALPDRALQPRVPIWLVVGVALTAACAMTLVSRHD